MKSHNLFATSLLALGLSALGAQTPGQSINDYQFAYEIEVSGRVIFQEDTEERSGNLIFVTGTASFSTDDLLEDYPDSYALFMVGDD